jgi:hypothetical protein
MAMGKNVRPVDVRARGHLATSAPARRGGRSSERHAVALSVAVARPEGVARLWDGVRRKKEESAC